MVCLKGVGEMLAFSGGYFREMSALHGWLLERDVYLTGVVI